MLNLSLKRIEWKDLAGVLAMEVVFFYTMAQMDYSLNLANSDSLTMIFFKLLTAAVSLAFAAVSFALLYYLPRFLIPNRFILVFLYLCVPLFLFVNVIYYRYFEMPLSLGVLYSIGTLTFATGYAYSLAKLGDLVYLLCTGIFLIISLKYPPKRHAGRMKAGVIIMLVFLASSIMRTGVYVASLSVAYGSIERAFGDSVLNNWDLAKVATRYGFLTLLANNLLMFENHSSPAAIIDARTRYMKTVPIRSGNRDFPNMIMLQVESLDYKVLGEKIREKEITPFLNSMINRSLFFSSFYAQHTGLGGTSDADFSSITSLYPLGYKPSFYAEGLDRLAALPFVLHRNGYTVAAFHANKAGFWGRSAAFEKLGFEQFFSLSDFAGLPGKGTHVADGPFLERTLEIIGGMDEPYYAFIITLSSHGDYSGLHYVPENMIDMGIRIPGDKQTENYFRVINYVDGSLRDFYKGLVSQNRPFVLFIYGDHTSGLRSEEYVSRADYVERIPLFIISSEAADPRMIDTPASPIDLPPTLLSIAGIPSPSDWQGIDLLSESRERLFLKSRRMSVDAEGKVRFLADGNTDWDKTVFKIEDYLQ